MVDLAQCAPAQVPALILDGQNRLATYAWSMRGPTDPRPDRREVSEEEAAVWYGEDSLVANARDRTVGFVPNRDLDPAVHFAPGIVADTVAMNRTIRQRMAQGVVMDDAAIDWLDEIAIRMRRTRTVVTTLFRVSPEEAFRHFRRINRAGVPMSDADLARTLGLAEEVLRRL